MNNTQQSYIGWFLIVLLIISCIAVSNVAFFILNKQENENIVRALSESTDELRVLLENNQSRLEKKMFDFKKSLHVQCDQAGDGCVRYRNLAKLLLLVIKMKDSLLRDMKFDNHINTIKALVSGLDDQDIENAVLELENVKEIYTLRELKLSFEEAVDVICYSQSNLFRKITSHWVKIKNKNDPLRTKFTEIEDSIDDNDWQSIAAVVSDLTHSEFKPWLSKLNNFAIAYRNISIIYHHLLQHIS